MKIYKYRIKVPNRQGKLVNRIYMFTSKDLEILLDYYKIPYEKVD